MRAEEMVAGKLYKLKEKKVVNLHFKSQSGKYMIVSEPGESDMQSMMGLPLDEEVQEVSAISVDGQCPCCDRQLKDIPSSHHTYKKGSTTHYCKCGWMGLNMGRTELVINYQI